MNYLPYFGNEQTDNPREVQLAGVTNEAQATRLANRIAYNDIRRANAFRLAVQPLAYHMQIGDVIRVNSPKLPSQNGVRMKILGINRSRGDRTELICVSDENLPE